MYRPASLYDEYEPLPALSCPLDGCVLDGWEGSDGPGMHLRWRQGQRLATNAAGERPFLLPERFFFVTECHDHRVEAEGMLTEGGTWAMSRLRTVRAADGEPLWTA